MPPSNKQDSLSRSSTSATPGLMAMLFCTQVPRVFQENFRPRDTLR